jgi:hypothetical protein
VWVFRTLCDVATGRHARLRPVRLKRRRDQVVIARRVVAPSGIFEPNIAAVGSAAKRSIRNGTLTSSSSSGASHHTMCGRPNFSSFDSSSRESPRNC